MPEARAGDTRPLARHSLPWRLAAGCLAAGAGLTLALLMHATAPWQAPASVLGGVASLMVWCVSPYAGLAGVLALARRRGQEVLVLLAGLAITGFGLLVLGDVLLVRSNPVNALVSLAVPWVQWTIVLAAAAIVAIWRVATPKDPKADPPPVSG
jgi:hypothetical protein